MSTATLERREPRPLHQSFLGCVPTVLITAAGCLAMREAIQGGYLAFGTSRPPEITPSWMYIPYVMINNLPLPAGMKESLPSYFSLADFALLLGIFITSFVVIHYSHNQKINGLKFS